MAVAKKSKRTMPDGGGNAEEINSQEISDNAASQPRKRNKAPGVRVVGGRIYDSQNGKTCHQCRQKTLDFSADCKNNVKDKPCTLKYCFTCLMNRYGEKAEDVASLEGWSCPRCRGLCNCSICMKKRGHNPTGMLVQMAKAGGFSSVSDMLHVKGAQNVGNYKNPKQIGDSPRKQAAQQEISTITSPKKPGKENIFDGKTDLNAIPPSVQNPVEKKPKKLKQKGLKVVQDDKEIINVSLNETSTTINNKHQSDTSHHSNKKKMKTEGLKQMPKADAGSPTKSQVSKGDLKKGILNEKVDGVHQETKKKNYSKSDENTKQRVNTKKYRKIKENLNLNDKSIEAVIPLPTGTELVAMAGIDIPKKDAGNALQFLEFCAAFGKILNVRKGQAEVVLRELFKGRSARRGKYSLITQFHIQLLSVIQEDSGSECPMPDSSHGSDSWLKALKSCVPDSKLEDFDCIDKEVGGYDQLNSSLKLRLLNFLCDEVLGTEKIRNWIDDQNIKFAEQRKEAKEKLVAAKDKEKCLKQKMQDDVAKAIIARKGVPLTIQEHESIVSEIKKKTTQAHAEMLECKRMVPIDKERPDATRTGPIFKDNKGHVYWILKGYPDKSDILLQDIGTGDDTVESCENWFQFDAQQMTLIDNHISALR